MKKFILLTCLAFGLLAAANQVSAQASSLTGTSTLTVDTITNADATSFKSGKTGSTIYLQVKILKISGTVAGYIDWEGSEDNTTFHTVVSDTLTNASKNWGRIFTKATPSSASERKWPYMRVTVTTTGTSSASVAVKKTDSSD